MINTGGQTGQRWTKQVTLRRMQIAARGIATKRPARAAECFPRRKPERNLEQDRNADEIERVRRRELAATNRVVTGREPIRSERQLDGLRAGKLPERIRLIRPVQSARTRRVTLETVLAALVIVE